jgi:endonuclease G, mitochondrial
MTEEDHIMTQLESILRHDALAQEIARKVPLVQPGERATGGAEERTTTGALRPRAPVAQPIIVTAPALPGPASVAAAREAVEAAVARAGFNEAIVNRFGRPVLLVRNDTFEVPASDTWKAILLPYKSRLDAAIPCVGRVEIVSSLPPYIGTAWMVTQEIAVTNRHVALDFARRRGNGWGIRRNPIGQEYRVRVDFKEEYLQTIPFEADLIEILYISELDDTQPDLAFVRLRSSGPPLPPPIPLFDGELREKQTVAVIGYPAEDPRNGAADQSRIFANIFDVKRLAPGEITGVADSFVFTHDCTTLGGNSGSVIVDVETGTAVGLHFAGEYLLDNYAVRASTIRELLHQVDRNVVFVSPPAPQPLETFQATLEDVRSRAGYDPHFLGDGEFAVPLPTLGPGLEELTVVVDENDPGMEKYLLKYTHFSITMHQDRKMALFTVSNIDGDQSRKIKRQRDVWGFDPRIPEAFQIGNQLYQGNDLDRGHLVRRLDPAWGTPSAAKQAEQDTFFFTNCTPQHAGFNQRLWLQLEDYLLNSADTRNFKACIFTGPIFTEEDRPYRGALLPLAYWKVAVMIHDQRDVLTATAYIMSQKDLLSRLEFVFGQFKTYQVSIEEIERRTNLDFGDLKRFDPLGQQEAAGIRELVGSEDLRL